MVIRHNLVLRGCQGLGLPVHCGRKCTTGKVRRFVLVGGGFVESRTLSRKIGG